MINPAKIMLCGIGVLFISGCTRHSVQVEAISSPDNRLIITEAVRPWPATIRHRVYIKLPPGDYLYDPAAYDQQTSWPERPVKCLKHSELSVFFDEQGRDKVDIDGGWLAIFRDGVELQLLWSGHPATINGRYTTKVPFAKAQKRP